MPQSVVTERAIWELVIAFLCWGVYVLFALRRFRWDALPRLVLASALLWIFLAPKLTQTLKTPTPVLVVLDDSASMTRLLDRDASSSNVYSRACALSRSIVGVARRSGAPARSVLLSQLVRSSSVPTSDAEIPPEKHAPNAQDSPTSAALGAKFSPDQAFCRVVLLSDGIENVPAPDLTNASLTRVDAVAVGSSEQAYDLRWEDVPTVVNVYPNEQARLRGKLRVVGTDSPRNVEVRLWDSDANKLLQTRSLTISGEYSDLDFSWNPPRDRNSSYRAEAVDSSDPLQPPQTSPLSTAYLTSRDQFEYARENNAVDFTIVPRSQKIKVLLIDDQPRYEYRYAKTILAREETVELRTLLFSQDPRTTEDDPYYFPLDKFDRKSLADFDAILIGDVPKKVWNVQLTRIADVVLKEGSQTSLWFLGGAIDDERLVPGKINAESEPILNEFVLTPTAEGKRVFADIDDLSDLFKEIRFTRIVPNVVPNATSVVLFNAKIDGEQTTPIFLVKSLDRNKIAWQGVDEIWRLHTLEDKAIYRRFLLTTLDYITSDRTDGANVENNNGVSQNVESKLDRSANTDVKSEKSSRVDLSDALRLELSDVAARTDVLEKIAASSGGSTLDLRNLDLETSKRQTEDFARRIFSQSLKIKTKKTYDLAPRKTFFAIALALFFLAWTPRFFFRRQSALPTSAEIIPPRDHSAETESENPVPPTDRIP